MTKTGKLTLALSREHLPNSTKRNIPSCKESICEAVRQTSPDPLQQDVGLASVQLNI